MKSRFFYAPFLMIAFVLVWPSTPVFAQLGVISGEVLDKQGNPIKDVSIRIEGMDNPRKYRVKTDGKGRYIHAGVALQGLYRVIAEKDGFVTDFRQGIKPGFGTADERGIINFELAQGNAGVLEFELTDEQKAEMQRKQEEARKQAEVMQKIKGDFDQGVAMFNAGEYQQAVSAFEKVIQVEDSQAVVWSNLAAAYSKLNENDKAITAYDKAIELDPSNSGYYQNKGSLLATMGKAEEARALYEKAASLSANLNPSDAAVNYYNMGVTYINSGQNQEAAEALTKALELDPNHAESHYQLGITQIGLGNMEEAMSHLKKYLELSPGSPNAEVAKALIEQLGG